jgi:hypothetical protein
MTPTCYHVGVEKAAVSYASLTGPIATSYLVSNIGAIVMRNNVGGDSSQVSKRCCVNDANCRCSELGLTLPFI